MYKQLTNTITLLLSIVTIIIFQGCSTEEEIKLPVFPGINIDKNTIFFLDTNIFIDINNNNKIYAVDTSSDTVIYTYNFQKNRIFNFVYDENMSQDLFLEISYKVYHLETATGTFHEIAIPYPIGSLEIIDNKVWVVPNDLGVKNRPVTYLVYDPVTRIDERITIPEGIITGSNINANIKINDKIYTPLYYTDFTDCEGIPTVYNVTDNKVIPFFSEKKYTFFHFREHKYQYAYHSLSDLVDIYHINSYEPLDAKLIMHMENIKMVGLKVIEDGEYVYFIDNVIYSMEKIGVRITKRKKDTFESVKEVFINKDFEPGGMIYFKNNHIWAVSPANNGAYKINTELEYEIVK